MRIAHLAVYSVVLMTDKAVKERLSFDEVKYCTLGGAINANFSDKRLLSMLYTAGLHITLQSRILHRGLIRRGPGPGELEGSSYTVRKSFAT